MKNNVYKSLNRPLFMRLMKQILPNPFDKDLYFDVNYIGDKEYYNEYETTAVAMEWKFRKPSSCQCCPGGNIWNERF